MTDIRAVLDTNVIISAIFWRGTPYQVLRRAIFREFELVISTPILEEVSDKLENKFGLTDKEREKFLDILLSYSHLTEPSAKLNIVKSDPEDNKILECALDGKAEFVVTGDKHLLDFKEFKGIEIIKPAQFLNKLK